MKTGKKSFIVLLCVAIVFIVGAVLGYAVPAILTVNPPIEMSQQVELSKTSSYEYIVTGKIKNISNDTITLGDTDISISIKDFNTLDSGWGLITLAPQEEYDLEDAGFGYVAYAGERVDTTVTGVRVTVNGLEYVLVGFPLSSLQIMLIVVFAILAFLFLILAFSVRKSGKQRALKRDGLISFSREIGATNYAVMSGVVLEKGETAKAAAKTAASVTGGLLFSIFFGVGVFSVHTPGQPVDMLLTDDALYLSNQNERYFNPQTATVFNAHTFRAQEIQAKKKSIKMISINGVFTITINTANSEMSTEQIAATLRKIFIEDASTLAQASLDGIPASTSSDGVDPFGDEFVSPTAATPAPFANSSDIFEEFSASTASDDYQTDGNDMSSATENEQSDK